jgi:hypothetical protein
MDAGYRHTTDDERRLLWLATSIRPCVIRLIEAYNAETIAAALGFTVNPDHTDMFGYSFDPIACDARA